MIVSINQPAYLPWMGYWDRIAKSDLHICLDHVQLEKGGFTNRTRIMQRDGRVMWLTIPVEKGKPINETRVEEGRWMEKHRRALEQAYGWFPEMWFPIDERLPTSLSMYLWRRTMMLNREFDDPPMEFVYFSSGLGGASLGAKSDLILNLCKEVGATTYLSGPRGRDYLDLPSFDTAGIEVVYHDFPSDGDWGLSAVHHLFSGETPCSTLPSLSKSADTTKPSGTTTGQSGAATRSTAPFAT